jgi:hypothetical protein
LCAERAACGAKRAHLLARGEVEAREEGRERAEEREEREERRAAQRGDVVGVELRERVVVEREEVRELALGEPARGCDRHEAQNSTHEARAMRGLEARCQVRDHFAELRSAAQPLQARRRARCVAHVRNRLLMDVMRRLKRTKCKEQRTKGLGLSGGPTA